MLRASMCHCPFISLPHAEIVDEQGRQVAAPFFHKQEAKRALQAAYIGEEDFAEPSLLSRYMEGMGFQELRSLGKQVDNLDLPKNLEELLVESVTTALLADLPDVIVDMVLRRLVADGSLAWEQAARVQRTILNARQTEAHEDLPEELFGGDSGVLVFYVTG